MRYSASIAAAVLSLALVSCENTATVPQEQLDESLASTLTGVGIDPNAETTGGHTATPPAASCSFDAATKWSTCTGTNNGLTITRQMQFLNASGTPQQRPDSTTTSMKAKTTITGTINFTAQQTGGPSGTTTVNRNSDETVTGLGPSSTQRVVNGTASGTENSTGTDSRGTVTVSRTFADTTKNLTLKSPPSMLRPFPESGTVTRYVTSSVKVNDGEAKNFSQKEISVFDAGKVTVTMTMNGQSRTCVIQLGQKDAKPVCTQ